MSDIVDGITSGLGEAWGDVITFIPKLVGALIILFVGWYAAKLVRKGAGKLLDGVGLDRILHRAGLGDRIEQSHMSVAGLVAGAVYWFLMLVVLLLASQTLEVAHLSDLLSGLIAYLPLVVAAVIIVVVAAAVGAFIADASAAWSRDHRIVWLPEVARWMVIGFGAIAALNTLNIAEEIVNTLFIGVVGTVGGILVVAFGVGGIPRAREWWYKTFPAE